jgi:hypothetical protein
VTPCQLVNSFRCFEEVSTSVFRSKTTNSHDTQSTDSDSQPQIFLYLTYVLCDEMKRRFAHKAVHMMNTDVFLKNMALNLKTNVKFELIGPLLCWDADLSLKLGKRIDAPLPFGTLCHIVNMSRREYLITRLKTNHISCNSGN